ncbi:MAG: MFS transporter [Pirellulaceae bacterium]|nr:MFS transporter [Pirellulaceae bacterium]
MSKLPDTQPAPRLTGTQWLICVIAAIGFAFDTYELLMAPLVLPPALKDLGGPALKPGTPEFQDWVGAMFYVPAICGGIFGLLGGYLTDLLGRRRVLTWSILLYAFSAFAAGFSTNLYMLLFFRCLVFVGVCVEFVAAVAWLAELFDHPRQRENVLGYTQAFSSVGGLLVTFASICAVAWSVGKSPELFFGISLPALQLPEIWLPDWLNFFGGEIKDHHAPWRYTLMSGVIPAIPLILIRPFLPESKKWAEKRASGKLKRPNILELFSAELRQTTLITTIMFACSLGAAFGALQQLPQIIPGVPEVKAEVKEAIQAAADAKGVAVAKLTDPEKAKAGSVVVQNAAAHATKIQEIGGLVGRFVLAILAVIIISRRSLLRVFQIPGLILLPIVFYYAPFAGINYLNVGIFFVGFMTVAQLSFWGNYLPRVYPVHLRGTGESFSANIGGRLIGTSMALVTNKLVSIIPGSSAPVKMACAAALVGFSVYLIGSIACFWLPEPKAETIDE